MCVPGARWVERYARSVAHTSTGKRSDVIRGRGVCATFAKDVLLTIACALAISSGVAGTSGAGAGAGGSGSTGKNEARTASNTTSPTHDAWCSETSATMHFPTVFLRAVSATSAPATTPSARPA
jgi:nitrate reductase alpha subunit